MAIKQNFRNSTAQYKHRVLTIRKFSLVYDEDEDEYLLEGPVKNKKQLRRQPVVWFENIFDKIHKNHFDRAHTGRVKTNFQV